MLHLFKTQFNLKYICAFVGCLKSFSEGRVKINEYPKIGYKSKLKKDNRVALCGKN